MYGPASRRRERLFSEAIKNRLCGTEWMILNQTLTIWLAHFLQWTVWWLVLWIMIVLFINVNPFKAFWWIKVALDFRSLIISFHFISFYIPTAERKTSLGKDWHGLCLKCEKCNKTLVPGQVRKNIKQMMGALL